MIKLKCNARKMNIHPQVFDFVTFDKNKIGNSLELDQDLGSETKLSFNINVNSLLATFLIYVQKDWSSMLGNVIRSDSQRVLQIAFYENI